MQIENSSSVQKDKNHTGINADRIGWLVRYNRKLDTLMDPLCLNEQVIDACLEALEPILSVSDSIEKYTLCRLTELALFCAGNYANQSRITEVGDFMINPRLILVHIKGEINPVIKERHIRLSEQFRDRMTDGCPSVEWLMCNTVSEIIKEPILPYLLKLLKKHQCRQAYIQSVKDRMNAMMTLLTHLSMADPPGSNSIEVSQSSLEDEDRIMMEALQYPCDTSVFHAFGKKIARTCPCSSGTSPGLDPDIESGMKEIRHFM